MQLVDYLPARNRLLAALRDADPAAEAQLRAGLESVEIKGHARVMRPDRPIRHVYFPETGVLSVLQQMRNGSSVAVNLVGSDGMVGLGVYLGALTYPWRRSARRRESSCACGPRPSRPRSPGIRRSSG